jgi:hypothetical protein
MGAILKGMSTAITAQRTSAKPLRVILGTIGNDFGMLTFMQAQGVAFDVIGFHVYPGFNQALIATDPWYGGGLLTALAAFGKPVRINEFNCGEVNASNYVNTDGSATSNTCLQSIAKHLPSLMVQTPVKVESVTAYELIDEGSKSGPEAHFGLMFDIDHPKLQTALLAKFAGGAVTAGERAGLTALGIN